MKNIDETRNYLIEEINCYELMSKNHKKVCTTVNYIEHFLSLGSTITGCVSISAFASLVGIPLWITNCATGLKICATTAAVKKCKSIINKKKTKHDQIVMLAKSKLNSIRVLISKALIESVINDDEFILINNVLKIQKGQKLQDKIRKKNTFIKMCNVWLKFIKGWVASGLLNSLGINVPLSEIPWVGPLLF